MTGTSIVECVNDMAHRRTVRVAGASLMLAFTGGSVHAGTLHFASFDDGTSGWRSSIGGDVTWAEQDGDGFLQFVDAAPSATFIEAPQEWLGDWSALDGRASLEFRHRVLNATGVERLMPYEVVLEGAEGGRAVWRSELEMTSSPEWMDLSVPIDSSAWQVEEGSWSTILESLSRLAIRIEVIDNDGDSVDVEGIDSIRLVSGVVPGASGLALVGSIAGGMRRRRL